MLEFIKGSKEQPSGNLIAWCRVFGTNPVQEGAEFIVCNIMVSFLDAHEQNFPVVVFPPIGADDSEDLNKLCNVRPDYDIIQLPDFEIPDKMKEGEYIEERLEDLNQIVVDYVEMCRDTYKFDGTQITTKKGKSKRISRNSLISDEEKTLNRLEETLSSPDKSHHELPGVLNYIQKTYPRYDVQNLKKVLKNRNPDLNELYIRKFRAIFHEEYEEAANLQKEIRELDPAT